MAGFLLVKGSAIGGSRIIDPLTLTFFEFDATISEDHSDSIEWTRNPVESGIDVTDHAIVQPEEVSITGVVSDTPLNAIPYPDRSIELYDMILEVARNKALVTVVTGLRVYSDMGITSVGVKRDNKSSNQQVKPVITLRQVRKVNSVEIPIPPELLKPAVKPGGQSPVDAGKQPADAIDLEATAPAPEAGALDVWSDKSLAAGIMDKWSL